MNKGEVLKKVFNETYESTDFNKFYSWLPFPFFIYCPAELLIHCQDKWTKRRYDLRQFSTCKDETGIRENIQNGL